MAIDWSADAEKYGESQSMYAKRLLRLTKDERALVRTLIVRAYLEGATVAISRIDEVLAEVSA